MKIKKFLEIFQRRGLEIFQNFHEIFKYFKVKYFICASLILPRFIDIAGFLLYPTCILGVFPLD